MSTLISQATKKRREIRIGSVRIGGDAPVVVQSMTKTHTSDWKATLDQIKKLQAAGCEMVRLAIPDRESVSALKKIREQTTVPLIADIHFDHRLALAAVDSGIDGLRINPGNIGSKGKVKEVVSAAKQRMIPIRIGVNAGSLEKELLRKYGEATPEAMVESAIRHIRILEDLDFQLIKVSLKASDVLRTVKAYELIAEQYDYPLHAGITEAGSLLSGSVKSSVGLALLLSKGLADTIRVSLTAPPEEEVRVAYLILNSLGLRSGGLNIISCPICGRCEVDLMRISAQIERKLSDVQAELTVAIMGCMVNGPGEAKEADIGLACGRENAVIFRQGKLLRKIEEKDIVEEFVKEVKQMAARIRK
ncbi:MAG: flavodoxin-dependent (E)-4-hydroxy-3-methylbut-2-enyl-diphosphate synthase [Candidatus Aminicenantes bacterium]|nr:flavodoxin-dependent (E)-4-hydroxy-3-methylbut-2-enyl-diphosphate synthase [Candidatus Aminicenantes bacterium]